ncbi:MAG: M20/M25/M40 family metallo-hydrolase [Gammaproteobacteria bacterium]
MNQLLAAFKNNPLAHLAKLAAGVLALLVLIVLARTGVTVAQPEPGIPFGYTPDADLVTVKMQKAIQLRTISYGRDKPTSAQAMLDFHTFLERSYPLVHQHLKREVLGGYSLLYRWAGSRPETGLPVLLLGHFDVVPIIPGTEDEWAHPPYSGTLEQGIIWGRGALDNKLNVIASLQAIEDMLEQGFQPQRDIYLAFGHDEEQGGRDGAGAIAQELETRGLKFEFLIDEGGAVLSNVIPGLDLPLALIAPAEKGIVTLALTAKARGGHSSTPPLQTAIGILAQALTRLEADPFPTDFSLTANFLAAIADYLPFSQRLMMNNLWLFAPVVKHQLWQQDTQRAALHTTTATTVIRGGVKSNVLPIDASAKVNFRILPGETPESVKARVEHIINDERITVSYDADFSGQGPSPVSPTHGFGWDYLGQVIRDTAAPDPVVIAPRLLVAATDTRHYRQLTPNHYRFTWIQGDFSIMSGIHGTNEHITQTNLIEAVRFYYRFLHQL